MPPRLNASQQGRNKIGFARKRKGWTSKDPQACREASKIIEPRIDWDSDENIANNLFADGASIETWKRFLSGKPINVLAFKAFCQILELDYLEVCEESLAKYELVLTGSVSELQKTRIEAILEHLRELLEDPLITLKEIEPGSIIFVLEGSLKGFERLRFLFKSSQLTEILGSAIADVRLKSIYPLNTFNIRQHLENLFNSEWQPVENLITSQSTRSEQVTSELVEEGVTITKAKKIDLGKGQSVTLAIKFVARANEELEAIIEVYPGNRSLYLPVGLKLNILDELDAIAITTQAKSYVDSLRLRFNFELEEEFKIKIILDELSASEDLFNN
jgi:hypothetical protein